MIAVHEILSDMFETLVGRGIIDTIENNIHKNGELIELLEL